MPANDLKPAARAIAFLWLLTSTAYLVNPQEGIGWIHPFPLLPKPAWVAMNLLVCALVLRFPGSIFWLLTCGLLAALSQMAWHSWIGAIAPWVPPIFLALAFFSVTSREQRRAAVEASFVLLTFASLLHRCNGIYLDGFEFGPAGSFSRAFPYEAKGWLASHAREAAIVWLALTASPLVIYFAGRKKQALWLFLAHGLATVFLYPVLFYGLFLLLSLLLALDSRYLQEWRWSRKIRPGIAPWHLYAGGQVAFFSWYSFWKDNFLLCGSLVFAILLCLLLARPPELPTQITFRSRRVQLWLAAFTLFLASPFFISSLPSPFVATYFSAREARFPPSKTLSLDNEFRSCRQITKETALRWGYEIKDENGHCLAKVYR